MGVDVTFFRRRLRDTGNDPICEISAAASTKIRGVLTAKFEGKFALKLANFHENRENLPNLSSSKFLF